MRFLVASLATLAAAAAPAQPPVVTPAPWPLDVVKLRNGATYRGLILKETPTGTEFRVILRQTGRPTMTLTTSFAANEIDAVERLPAADRATLRTKLAELDPDGDGERRRMEALALTPAPWLGSPAGALRYESERFVLVSAAPEGVTRRAAVRLEQIFAAYARFFPPRREATKPTEIFLAGRADDFRRLLGAGAPPVLNAAVYDPAANRVVCGSDLYDLGRRLAEVRAKHDAGRARLAGYEAKVRDLYAKSPAELGRHLDTVRKERGRLAAADRQNSRAFDGVTRQLFGTLYHEAFHAYIATSVYPPATVDEVRTGKGPGELPRWLNEGLAQHFETAVVEAGELRVGNADEVRLTKTKELFAAAPPDLAALLRSGPEAFLAAHADQRAGASRAYLTSWAVTFHLAFVKRVLGSGGLPKYLAAVNAGGDPVTAFEAWVGQDLPAFEADLRDTVARLTPAGTLAPKRP